jgi:hypothetical protein
LPDDVSVTTASELNELVRAGRFKISNSRSIAEADSLNQRIKALAAATLPQAKAVAVISKGDDELVDISGCRARHFPEAADGKYAGFHPADGPEAISHLENARGKGVQFLLIPAASFWWLDYYTEFRQHLDGRYKRIAAGEDCIIYDLAGSD